MPCPTTQSPCTDGAGHSPSASSRPLPSAWLLSSFTTLLLDVSRPAFPIAAGFPSPNCMSRPHSRERSHTPWQGYSLPVWPRKDCWDWGPYGLFSYGLTCSQCNTLYLKVMSWEEPAALARLIFPLSGWHKPHHYWCSFYLLDFENPKLFSYHSVFMFSSLAGYEIFLWWNRWLTLSSPLFIISWHLVLSFVFMVRCFFSLWVFRIQIPFLKSQFIHLETWLGNFFPLIFLLNGEISPYRKATLFSYIVVNYYKTRTKDQLCHGKRWQHFFVHVHCPQMVLSVLEYVLVFSKTDQFLLYVCEATNHSRKIWACHMHPHESHFSSPMTHWPV